MGELRIEAEHIRLLLVESEYQERTVEEGHATQGDGRRNAKHDDVCGRRAEHISEEDGHQVHGEGSTARDEDDAEGEHADEQQPDRGVLRQRGGAMDQRDGADHDDGGHRRTEDEVHIEQEGDRHPGKNPVCQRITHEGEPSQHHPGPDHRRRHNGEQRRQQRPLHEVEGEGVGQPVHIRYGANACTMRSALVCR